MAKRKKKKNSRPQPAPIPVRKKTPWGWIVACSLVTLAALALILIFLLSGNQQGTQPEDPNAAITPTVDTTNQVSMRIVKPGSAYVEPNDSAATVYYFRKGDVVNVVNIESTWATIAVEGRPYYLPTSTLRAMDEFLVVIDAGHQIKVDNNKEALGPDGTETEPRMEAGNVGVSTFMQEHELTMAVALKLKDSLEQKGYQVILTRNHSGVEIVSNAERAQVANKLYADAYISLHASSSEDDQVQGVYTMCQTSNNSFNGDLYTQSKSLSDEILEAVVTATGATKLSRQETDKVSGINWSQVPVSFVEMGYLSNVQEDQLLATEEYQQKLAEGIANGIDRYFTTEDK